jgi:transcriptional regulator with XRE-family HTH domain
MQSDHNSALEDEFPADFDSEGEVYAGDDDQDDGAHASPGELLRRARERKRLTLAHVAAETRIPVRHLETIEAGDFAALPSRTYAIGFARTYARAVGLNETTIADLIREDIGQRGPRYSSIGQGMEPGDPAKLPSAALAWFGGLAALVLVIGVIAFASTYYGEGAGPESLLASAESQQEAAPDPSGDARLEQPAAPAADGQVVFTALEDGVWVRFYEADGERLFEDTMQRGDTFEIPGEATAPLINTGRPDALAITIDGREVPKLAEEPVTMGDTPISAQALLARVPS